MRAEYANADGSDVWLIRDDGSRMAVKPTHPELAGLSIAPFVPPPPAPAAVADLLALRAQIDAAIAALAQSQP